MSTYDLYREWIVKNVPNSCAGQCTKYVNLMVKAFPELKKIRGHIRYWNDLEKKNKRSPHWWTKAPDGCIFDPTAVQFAHLEFHYEEWEEGQKEPTGKCPNCGEYSYDHNYLCSAKCEKEFREYIHS